MRKDSVDCFVFELPLLTFLSELKRMEKLMQDQKIIAVDYRGMTLEDLFNICQKQKKLIFVLTLVCVIVSICYLIMAKPIYEAKAGIISPNLSDIAPLNIGRNNKTPLKIVEVNTVYKVFGDILLREWQIAHSDYWKAVTVRKAPNMEGKFIVTGHANSQVKANDLLRKYIALVKQKAELEVLSTLNIENELFAQSLKNKIDSAKYIAKASRYDRLSQLNEALVIAEKAGIKDYIRNNSNAISDLYLHGSKVLSAEISVLRSRKDDEAFINNLRQLNDKYNFYSNITIPLDSFKLYRLDGPMDTSETRVSPKVVLTLILSILGGLILGVVIALMRSQLSSRRAVFRNTPDDLMIADHPPTMT